MIAIDTKTDITAIVNAITVGKRVGFSLPENGRLQIDRALPFLCIYRRPIWRCDDELDRLITGESIFFITSGEKKNHNHTTLWLQTIAETLGAQFGSFLIIEIWTDPDQEMLMESTEEPPLLTPGFKLIHPRDAGITKTVTVFETALASYKAMRRQPFEVMVEINSSKIAPPGLPQLVNKHWLNKNRFHYLGVAVRPVFRKLLSSDKCEIFPALQRTVRSAFSKSLRKAVYEFSRQTEHNPPHFQALGPRAVTKRVYDVDRRIANINDQFDYLFLVTPINVNSEWLKFSKVAYARIPEFNYRQLTFDVISLKRLLFAIPVERIEDPALADIFREKLDELDRLLTLMGDCGTKRFLPGSIQVFGNVEKSLYNTALEILQNVPARLRQSGGKSLNVQQIAHFITTEFAHYTDSFRDFPASVQIRDDFPDGILVADGTVILGKHTRIPANRVTALLHHEIGIHLVTFYNGSKQPLRLLAHGLAGYDAFQEGLAVLAEYLTGGFTNFRLRLLAIRVIAVNACIGGADFVETFRLLTNEYGISPKPAFLVAMRVYRGGGLTKDAVYLRGLLEVLNYLSSGDDLEPLWSGKIALRHLPIIRELRWRKFLNSPCIIPRFLADPLAQKRLHHLRSGKNVIDLIRKIE